MPEGMSSLIPSFGQMFRCAGGESHCDVSWLVICEPQPLMSDAMPLAATRSLGQPCRKEPRAKTVVLYYTLHICEVLGARRRSCIRARAAYEDKLILCDHMQHIMHCA